MELQLMIGMEGVTELDHKDVAQAGKVYNMEGDAVLEAPIPKENALCTEGGDPGPTLLVDIDDAAMLLDNTWTWHEWRSGRKA